MKQGMITFRTGTHNPFTIYVTGRTAAPFGGRGLAGWMRQTSEGDSEWFLGSLPEESLAQVAVEALNAFVCRACPWGCTSCTLNRANCECYEHGDNVDEDGEPIENQKP